MGSRPRRLARYKDPTVAPKLRHTGRLWMGRHIADRAGVPCATLTKQRGIGRTSTNLRGPQRGKVRRAEARLTGARTPICRKNWRRGGDSNPRYPERARRFSKPARTSPKSSPQRHLGNRANSLTNTLRETPDSSVEGTYEATSRQARFAGSSIGRAGGR